ncbi:MAG: hypothetical protein QOJ12_93 [Thermoleophilales bacterium]|nr:hypothetical protein [Thermoleophilales bacterium]
MLDDLEPLGRALLDLSLKRGMSDAEIAEVLGTDADAVLENRIALMRAVADKFAPESTEVDLSELEAIVAEHLYGATNGAELQPPAPVPAPEPEAQPARKRRSPLLVLLPLLLVGALIGVIIGLANTGNDKASTPPAVKTSLQLAPLAGHSGRAAAAIDGNRLHLTVSGLAGGAYEAWLYNSIADARPIGRLKAPAGTLDARLPANWRDYRYLDVSLEPPDGNPNHSGETVLRAPLRP